MSLTEHLLENLKRLNQNTNITVAEFSCKILQIQLVDIRQIKTDISAIESFLVVKPEYLCSTKL